MWFFVKPALGKESSPLCWRRRGLWGLCSKYLSMSSRSCSRCAFGSKRMKNLGRLLSKGHHFLGSLVLPNSSPHSLCAPKIPLCLWVLNLWCSFILYTFVHINPSKWNALCIHLGLPSPILPQLSLPLRLISS